MRVVVAIPTIDERPGLADYTAILWNHYTPGHQVECVITRAGESWGDGLNDVWQQIRHDPPDVFVCGSDDMQPDNNEWLPSIHAHMFLAGDYPAPRVNDPRFVNFGGHLFPVPDGTPSEMSSFPILRGDWLDKVFPLPAAFHYFADNYIAAMLHLADIHCVAVPTCRINHLHAREGRGAGYGSENTRLFVDTVRYTRALEERGIDRLSLPASIRGHMWEPHHQQVGVDMGA